MKKIFILLSALVSFSAGIVSAQSFTIQHDTVTGTPSGLTNIEDGILPATGTVTLDWHVFWTNFPTDWQTGSGICDNKLCYPMSGLWPSGASKTSLAYSAPGPGDFHAQINLDPATTLGCYILKVKLTDHSLPADTAMETYIVCKNSPTAAPVITRTTDDVILYPNPATNEVNVVYDAGADVKNIAVYSVIGKMAAIYKVNGNSANLNLENIPAGIYFVRLVNSQGNVVATRKFSKQ